MKKQIKYKAVFYINGIIHEERLIAESESLAYDRIKDYYTNSTNINIKEL